MKRADHRPAFWTVLIGLIATMGGCSDNPIDNGDIACDHIDVDGVVVENASIPIAAQYLGAVTGNLEAVAGLAGDTLLVTWLDDDSLRITVPPECPDHGLRFMVEDTTIAQVVPVPGTRWSFRIVGRRAGSTTIRLRLWHGDHADFTSLQLPVVVAAGIAPSSAWIRTGCSVSATWNYNADRGPNVTTGTLLVAPGARLPGLMVEWLGDWDPGDGGAESGHRPILEVPDEAYRFEWLVADQGVARIEPVASDRWRFDLVGVSAGTTTLRLILTRRGEAILTTGPMPVRVVEEATLDDAPDFYLKRNGVTEVIVKDGATVASACNRNAVPGRLDTGLGDLSDLIFLKFLDADCGTTDPSNSRDTLVFQFENACLVEVTGHPVHWGERSFFHLEGRQTGETSMRVTFLRDGVPRWVSPPITVRVAG